MQDAKACDSPDEFERVPHTCTAFAIFVAAAALTVYSNTLSYCLRQAAAIDVGA